jgi:NAD(P)-dependent dehydrogenase (short-subunit alcohol dehydrogenase family)
MTVYTPSAATVDAVADRLVRSRYGSGVSLASVSAGTQATYRAEALDALNAAATGIAKELARHIATVVAVHGDPQVESPTHDEYLLGYAAGRRSLSRIISDDLERITHGRSN